MFWYLLYSKLIFVIKGINMIILLSGFTFKISIGFRILWTWFNIDRFIWHFIWFSGWLLVELLDQICMQEVLVYVYMSFFSLFKPSEHVQLCKLFVLVGLKLGFILFYFIINIWYCINFIICSLVKTNC